MRIRRRGTRSDRGYTSVTLNPLVVSWDRDEDAIKVSSSDVIDFDSTNNHNYDVFISGAELQQIVDALVRAAGQ